MVALNPRPNDTVRATTLANCSPSPSAQRMSPAAKIGNIPGKNYRKRDNEGSKRKTDEGCHEQDLNHQPVIQFLDHRRTILGGDHRQARQRYLVTWVLTARSVRVSGSRSSGLS